MRLHLDSSAFSKNPALLKRAFALLSEDAIFLRDAYPNFDSWLHNKVIPGILSGDRTVLIELRSSAVVGFMILKHNQFEKKLCTLRVRPLYESRGIGVRLFDVAFEILGTERPLLSVSERSMPKFEALFKHFGFSQEAIYESRYVPKVRELAFNGLLDGPESKTAESFCLVQNSQIRLKHSFNVASPDLVTA